MPRIEILKKRKIWHMSDELIIRIRKFMENEARSCSMDFGGIIPLYVYRMWGGKFSMVEIENGLTELRNQGFIG